MTYQEKNSRFFRMNEHECARPNGIVCNPPAALTDRLDQEAAPTYVSSPPEIRYHPARPFIDDVWHQRTEDRDQPRIIATQRYDRAEPRVMINT